MSRLIDSEKIARVIIRFRWLIILLVVFITLFTGSQLKNLYFDTDLTLFLPKHDPAIDHFREVDDIFEGALLTLIGLETDEVFTPQNLTAIHELTEEISKIPGLGQVTSLTNIIDIRKIEGGIEVKNLINPDDLPDDSKTLDALRDYVLSKDMYRGNIVSPDGKASIIITKHLVDSDQPEAFRAIMDATEQVISNSSHTLHHAYFAGLTPQMHYIEQILNHDFKLLIPTVIFLVVFVLFLNFRSLRGIFLPLFTVIFATTWVMGTMALLGRPLTLAHNTIPILLIAVGSAYGIHIVNRYYEEVTTIEGKIPGMLKTVKMIGLPVFLAGLTTMIGFFSFVTSTMPPFREAGIFIALGIGFALLISLFFIPSCLVLLRVRESPKQHHPKDTEDYEEEPIFVFKIFDQELITRVLERLGRLIPRVRKLILIVVVLVAAVCIAGLPRLTREVNFIEYFKEDAEYRIAENMMMKYFGGSQALWIDTQAEILNPFVLKELFRISLYIDTIPHSTNSQSIADLICETNFQMNGRYAIPDDPAAVANLWIFLEGNEYADMFVRRGNTRGLIQSKVDTYNTLQQMKVVEEVRNFLDLRARKKIVVVDRESLDPGEAAAIGARYNEIIEENIDFLIQKKLKSLGKETYAQEAGKLREKIRPVLKETGYPPPLPSPEMRENIENRIIRYLGSEEAEIEITDRRLRENIGKDLVSLPGPSIPAGDTIKSILENNLWPLAPDKRELLGWLAGSLRALIEEETRNHQAANTLTQITPFLPQELIQDENFMKYLGGILWSAGDRLVGLDENTAARLGEIPVRETVEISFVATGGPVLFARLYPLLVDNMIRSIFIALILVLAILIAQQRSFIGGLISIAPISLTVLINFGIMSYLQIPIDDSTMMIASIAIGIGIDYSIHFISRFQEELALGKTEPDALSATLRTTGKAILTNAASVMMGFFVLTFSSVVPTQRFGWLTGLMMLVSSISALTVLPALLLSTEMQFIRKKIPKLLRSKRFEEIVRKQISRLPGSSIHSGEKENRENGNGS